ncbi:MAG: glycoside hydrolase family 3 C-terminal domain-containing protein, partial [Rhodospirillaceae bacterium]|nr:glycoside hydrolase family 3 C-terminal domain-containing protein [Rhodospirillaceae bacterium]
MTRGNPADRIERLLGAMTLDEKLGQLNMLTADLAVTGPGMPADYMAELKAGRLGSMLNLFGADLVRAVQRVAVEETRLGIPLFFGFDVIHGHRTIFPIPLAEAGAFDPALWERTARIAAVEAAAEGLTLTFAPMLDVARDPRWGRIAESAGEDTWLTERLAEAKTRGYQGADLASPDAVAATAKHFAAYGAVMAGREYAEVAVSERAFHETYLPPFRAAVAAGAAAIMPAFTDLAGVPLTAHVGALRDLLRGRWGFDGIVISDYNAVAELMLHGVAGDLATAAALALKAGVDIDMMATAYTRALPEALRRGLVEMGDIDTAVRRVLAFKARMGLFDDPYHRGMQPLDAEQIAAHRAAARDAARRSVVLLANRDGALPIAAPPKRLALIGPLADAADEMLGSWSGAGRGEDMVSYAAGLRRAWPDCVIDCLSGVEIDGADTAGIAAAAAAARKADRVILCLGEARWMSGEAGSRARPDLPARQAELAEAVFAAAQGKPVVVVLTAGRPLLVPWLFEKAAAVLMAWQLGSEAGNALADIVTGRWNPSARLPLSWPVEVGQIPIFYSRLPTGRPRLPEFRYSSKYLDLPNEPLFAFGHGLSYTRFVYSNLGVSEGALRAGTALTV